MRIYILKQMLPVLSLSLNLYSAKDYFPKYENKGQTQIEENPISLFDRIVKNSGRLTQAKQRLAMTWEGLCWDSWHSQNYETDLNTLWTYSVMGWHEELKRVLLF